MLSLPGLIYFRAEAGYRFDILPSLDSLFVPRKAGCLQEVMKAKKAPIDIGNFPPHQPVVKKKLLVGILKQLDGHGQQLIWYRQK